MQCEARRSLPRSIHTVIKIPAFMCQVVFGSARLLAEREAGDRTCNPARKMVPSGLPTPVTAQRPVTLTSPWPSLPPRVDNYSWLRDDSRTDPDVLAHLVRLTHRFLRGSLPLCCVCKPILNSSLYSHACFQCERACLRCLVSWATLKTLRPLLGDLESTN